MASYLKVPVARPVGSREVCLAADMDARVIYRCVECEALLVNVVGSGVRVKHWRHRSEGRCGGESFGHLAGKTWWRKQLGNLVTLEYRCGCGERVQRFVDLTECDDVEVEWPIFGGVADVVFFQKGRPRFILEVVVSHFCEAAKVAALKESGVPWVEVSGHGGKWNLAQRSWLGEVLCRACELDREKSRLVGGFAMIEEEVRRRSVEAAIAATGAGRADWLVDVVLRTGRLPGRRGRGVVPENWPGLSSDERRVLSRSQQEQFARRSWPDGGEA